VIISIATRLCAQVVQENLTVSHKKPLKSGHWLCPLDKVSSILFSDFFLPIVGLVVSLCEQARGLASFVSFVLHREQCQSIDRHLFDHSSINALV
jgi:hypothetical protein